MNNRHAVTLRFNIDERARLRELVSFWQQANGGIFLTEKDVLKLAFDQFVTATAQLIKKKEAAGEFDTKVVGGSGTDKSTTGTEGVSASADGAPATEIVRDESTGNLVEQAVSGS